jgi:hypothetical protein
LFSGPLAEDGVTDASFDLRLPQWTLLDHPRRWWLQPDPNPHRFLDLPWDFILQLRLSRLSTVPGSGRILEQSLHFFQRDAIGPHHLSDERVFQHVRNRHFTMGHKGLLSLAS